MREGQSIPAIPEKESERILTPEEVRAVFEQLIEGEKYTTARQEEDEDGLYLWDVVVSEKDEEGGTTEYTFMRKGQYPEGVSATTAIHVTYFDKEGAPIGGRSVAKYIEGEWMLAV